MITFEAKKIDNLTGLRHLEEFVHTPSTLAYAVKDRHWAALFSTCITRRPYVQPEPNNFEAQVLLSDL